jgi:hypothetical protein
MNPLPSQLSAAPTSQSIANISAHSPDAFYDPLEDTAILNASAS